jgi:folate-binding protein YgfZ
MGAYIDISNRTLLSMKGADSQDLLQRISTNDLSKLQTGGSVQTILTNEKGRIVDSLVVHKRNSSEFLLAGRSKTPEEILGWLNKFIIMEDVKVRNVTGDFFQFQVFDISYDEISPYLSRAKIPILRSECRRNDFALSIAERDKEVEIRQILHDHAIDQWSDQDYETFRVERGIPDWPYEICDRFNPLELGLEHLVSFSKGCYVGQEVIARLDTYKKVQKRLVRFGLESDPTTLPAILMLADKEVGIITSTASSNDLRFESMAVGFLNSATETTKDGFYYLNDGMSQSAHLLSGQ